jgi:crotonobetainyl-CoA:carnitine CoA-transferase CaiB-like acyl-CoA transferase
MGHPTQLQQQNQRRESIFCILYKETSITSATLIHYSLTEFSNFIDMSEFSSPPSLSPPSLSHQDLPLYGIKVIDFGQPIAGSAVGMVLADMGASVVSICRVGSFAQQPPYCATLNRNKLCVELDLKSSEGLKQALELVATADVVVDSFRPGVMKRLGIDYATLRDARPSLITLSIPGFASNDPVRCDWKGMQTKKLI